MRASFLCRVVVSAAGLTQFLCGSAVAQVSGLGDGIRVPLTLKQKRESAKWLQNRQAELKKNGHQTKSHREQQLTWLRVIRRRHERLALRTAQTAACHEARSEVFTQLAKKQIQERTRYKVLTFEGNTVDGFTPRDEKFERKVTRNESVRWPSNFAPLAAKHKGIAKALRFRAETYYPARIRNTDRRIQELEALPATEN